MNLKKEPLFLIPIFQERIWGGTTMNKVFNYEFESKKIGECWGISAHPNGLSVVENSQFQGQTLKTLWENHRELFGNLEGEEFPLLIKILDAKDDLSVQVHPNDEYADFHEDGESGKAECWYVIDCDKNSELILGHNAKTRDEANQFIMTGEWDQFLRRVQIKPGDFIYLPSGTVHAIGKGTLILETQQNSDLTYRLYDFDRIGSDGKLRELHIKKSLDVLTIPHVDTTPQQMEFALGDTIVTLLAQTEFFTVIKWEINSEATFMQEEPFLNVSILKGSGELICESGIYPLRAGMHFILPSEFGEFTLKGRLVLIVSYV